MRTRGSAWKAVLCLAGVVVVLTIAIVTLPWTMAIGSRALDAVLSRGGGDSAPVASADLSRSGPGSLVSATTMPRFANSFKHRGLLAARVVYRSTSGDTGQPTTVSGAVFVPAGAAPAGGWPVISFGHGTTGIQEPCAPSLSDSLLGIEDSVVSLTGAGYAVALTDYQGLGSEGVHPYTDAKTAGLNMIDAVRALRWTFGDVSNRWAAIGASQGGGAAWAADEQASAYAPDMELVGALAISPAADVSRLVEKAQAGTLTPDQRPAFQAIIESLAKLHLDINRDDFRSGSAARNWDILSACSGPDVLKRNAAAEALGPSDLKPRSSKAAQQIQNYLSKWALPQQRLSAPLFVWYSGMDTLIDAEWTRASIEKACQLGGDVQWKFEADKGHGETDVGGLLPWVVDRFAGKPAGDDCA